MLKNYMESKNYYDEIEAAVDSKPEYKDCEKMYLDSLKSLNLDRENYDKVDGAAVQMMSAARELA